MFSIPRLDLCVCVFDHSQTVLAIKTVYNDTIHILSNRCVNCVKCSLVMDPLAPLSLEGSFHAGVNIPLWHHVRASDNPGDYALRRLFP